MKTEEKLLKTWRTLPQDKQQEVIDFVEFLDARLSQKNPNTSLNDQSFPKKNVPELKTPLAQKLWEIRQKGIATGEVKQLDWEEIEKEVKARRGMREYND